MPKAQHAALKRKGFSEKSAAKIMNAQKKKRAAPRTKKPAVTGRAKAVTSGRGKKTGLKKQGY